MFYDLGQQYYIDMIKAKVPAKNVFRGKKYRISIISDVLIRFEYSETGSFSDYPTFFARNRSFGTPTYKVQEDSEVLIIRNDIFVLEYTKEKPFMGTKFLPDQYLKVMINDSDKIWYFNHPEVRNFMGTSYSLDDSKGKAVYEKGLFSLDGFTTFDDSRTPILNKFGNIIAPNYKSIDTYLFIYNNDFGVGLKDYFNLTGMPPLIPKYALGVWWSKNEQYNEADIQKLVKDFHKYGIPLSVIMLGEYARQKNSNSNISFSFNKNTFPHSKELSDVLHKSSVRLGLNIKTDGLISTEESNYETFSKLYQKDAGKCVLLNIYDSKFTDSFLKGIINPLINSGVDFFWIDDNNKDNKLRDYTINYFLFNNFSQFQDKRNFVLSRNNGICPHTYGALYSGNTIVSWKTLKLLPFFNATAANIGVSWWSHDIGGYKGGVEDSELYMRYIQLGVYSPIFRLSSDSGKYYKRAPWKWDAKTYKIVSDYIRIRQRLIPYIYSEAKRYSMYGSPLIQPLYYKYPETYDEPLYKNEFYFGSELFVAPITDGKDAIMSRVVQKIFLPNGVWYEFKTGKKFNGGKRYTTFYKDEDYPVFAPSGAIVPLSILDNNNLNDLSSPSKLEIQIFPGKSNVYKLYEDDGVSNMYKQGYSFTTEIKYNYKQNDYSVEFTPVEGKIGVLPEKRNYVIKFRNTKFTEGVQVFENEKLVPYRRYSDDNDFVVEFDNVPTISKVLVYCKGNNIELDTMRLINEDIESIITDAKIPTVLKVELDKIMFSDTDIKTKRINIRKLKRSGLQSVFVKMFMKLLEYMEDL